MSQNVVYIHAITKIVMTITLAMKANTMMTMEITRKHIKRLHVLGITYSYSNPLVNSNHAPPFPSLHTLLLQFQ